MSQTMTAPMATTIRALTVEELPLCVPFAHAFHTELKIRGEFIPEVFLKNWTLFFERYPAVILGLWEGGEQLIGGLGALVVPDLSDGRLCASELFWFVDHTHRTGLGGVRLLKAFDTWALSKGAVEVRMVHLEDGDHDTQFDRFYRRLGYHPVERCYIKVFA